jgi:hypothetical protein
MRRVILPAAAGAMLLCIGFAAEAAPFAGAATQMHNGTDAGAAIHHVEWYWRNHHRYWRDSPRRRPPPPPRHDEHR